MVGIAALAGAARANEADDENARTDLVQLAKAMPGITPDAGRDTAPLRSPPWCAGVRRTSDRPYAISAAYQQWKHDGFLSLIKAARYSCDYAQEPAGQQAATMIEQAWINLTGLSEVDAVESINARVHEQTWDADHQKLCDALTVEKDVRGEDLAFVATHRLLFGCPGHAQWGERAQLPTELLAFVDQSDVPADELIRLSRVLERVSEPLNSTNLDHRIVGYAIDAYDFRALATFKLKILDAPPYAGNPYARVIVKESLARARLGIATLEAEVKKRVTDADWKELLISAPQRGIEAYLAAAQAAEAPIARSNAFERKASAGSKRAVAGCLPELRKDFVEVYKKLPHASANQARESLSDPVASLLFSRLLVCMAMDGEEEIGSDLYQYVQPDVRKARGVRTAAYYAAIEALGKIRADRERFPIKPEDLQWTVGHLDVLHELRPNKRTSFDFDGAGIVKTVHKIAGGLHVTFVTSKHQEMSRSCTPTNRIVQIRSDGSIQYYQNCRDTGLVTVNDTPEEITIPTLLADGVTPGCAIEFRVSSGHKLERVAAPRVVYSDKTKKKVVNYFGFAL